MTIENWTYFKITIRGLHQVILQKLPLPDMEPQNQSLKQSMSHTASQPQTDMPSAVLTK